MFVCATKATSHGASKEHNELSARLSLHLQWGGGIAAHLVCCHGTTLLLFLQPTAARGLGSSEGLIVQSHAGSTCSQTGWHSYQSLIFKTNIFTRFHWFWFLGIKQRRLLRNKSIKTCKSAGVSNMACIKVRSDQRSNITTGNINRINGISLDYRLMA